MNHSGGCLRQTACYGSVRTGDHGLDQGGGGMGQMVRRNQAPDTLQRGVKQSLQGMREREDDTKIFGLHTWPEDEQL